MKIREYFKKKKEKEAKMNRLPDIGEIRRFGFQRDKSPWASDSGHHVEVLDAKAGWVRYRFLASSSIFQDERMEVKTFNKLYENISDD